MDGILNINKPRGKTSFSIVSAVKRLSGVKRVGHAGTLDPAATGVLLICLGQGTRVTEFLIDDTKTYRAEIEFGITTDTFDGDGVITAREDPAGIDREKLESALSSFLGLTHQIPPMYSAVKYRGKPLYRLAREGKSVERKIRQIKIDSVELLNWQPPVAEVEIVCGKGTYIRSLAHDLGQTLECGAYLKNLVRTRCGIFDVADSVTPEQFKEAAEFDRWQDYVHPIDSVFTDWMAIVVDDETREAIRNGRPLDTNDEAFSSPGTSVQPGGQGTEMEKRCRVYTLDGDFVALLRFNPQKCQWQPDKVFI